ncbi:E3 ubiquitin-protein ligase RNF170-like [Ruditapes philippinarum]|uniref:E3 ubiquitin-protein ligase RNF170-like n=1 Tax=Ruditapes philippinarum TaxID=129788 RepID=UPI00295A5B92|nr:E3 ubiquitin-protein ligase RNF170-like [Ruditapes philippinarum]XP_060558575.1 E3 ubiquitin-protein ligase RNF170-like [Ruditapes philippinarum]
MGRNMWIEGIGDDVLYAIGAFFGMFIPIVITVYQRSNSVQRIHPESEENVRETREEVEQQRAQQDRETQTQQQTAGDQQERNRPMRENHGQHQCPICLGTAEYAVQTNCGHIFCGLCLITYWHHGRWLGPVVCPVCRQTVTLMLVNFTQDEHNSASPEKRNIVDSIYQYNRRFSGEPRQWMDYIRDLPTLLRHAISEFFTVGGLVFMFRIRIFVIFILAFLYFISPLDIIPEALFGIFGFLDDFFILLLLAIYVSLIYRSVVQQRATAGAR